MKEIKLKIAELNSARYVRHIEQALKQVPGITHAYVHLSNRTIRVQGDVSIQTVIRVLKQAGYTATELSKDEKNSELLHYQHLLRQTFVSGTFGIILMTLGFTS